MGYLAYKCIKKHSQVDDPVLFAVLGAIGHYIHDGGAAFPSFERLAKDTRYSASAVKRSIKKLEKYKRDDGLFELKIVRSKGRVPNCYEIPYLEKQDKKKLAQPEPTAKPELDLKLKHKRKPTRPEDVPDAVPGVKDLFALAQAEYEALMPPYGNGEPRLISHRQRGLIYKMCQDFSPEVVRNGISHLASSGGKWNVNSLREVCTEINIANRRIEERREQGRRGRGGEARSIGDIVNT